VKFNDYLKSKFKNFALIFCLKAVMFAMDW